MRIPELFYRFFYVSAPVTQVRPKRDECPYFRNFFILWTAIFILSLGMVRAILI